MKEADPRSRSVALFNNPTNQHAASFNRKMTADGASLGMQVQIVDIAGEGDLEAAFEPSAARKRNRYCLPRNRRSCPNAM